MNGINIRNLINVIIKFIIICLAFSANAQKNIEANNVDNNLLKLAKDIKSSGYRNENSAVLNHYIIKGDKILCCITKHGKADWKDFKNQCESTENIVFAKETFSLGFQNAFVPFDAFERLIKLETIGMVYAIPRGITNTGDVITEADSVLFTNVIRDQYSLTGKGVKIGIISDGIGPISAPDNSDLGAAGNEVPTIVNSLSQLDNEGPQLYIIENNEPNNKAEGLAMIELIHDIAPGADLIFCDPIDDSGNPMTTAIETMKNAGCHIIVDDYSWPSFSFFQSNVGNHVAMKDAIETFTDQGGIFVSAVGNFKKRWIVQNYVPNSNNTHLFSQENGDESLSFVIPEGRSLDIYFQWSNPWDDAYDDFNISLFDQNGILLASDDDVENENVGNPYARIVYENNTNQPQNVDFRIELASSAPSVPITFRLLIIDGKKWAVESDKVYFDGSGSVISHQMYNEVLSIGTSNWNDLSKVTGYSSAGPVILYGDINDPSSGRNILLENAIVYKPDFTSVDSVSVSGAFNFGYNSDYNPNTPPVFLGTSAAAPHFAALLALIKEARPNLSREEIISILKQHSEKFGPYIYNKADGKSNESGYGRVNVLNLFQNLPPIAVNYTKCFDIVYADYNYQCGQSTLSEVTGEQFRYGGRDCDTDLDTVVDNTNTGNEGGGGNGGPGGPGGSGTGTNIGTSTSLPNVTTKNEECQECIKELQKKVQLLLKTQN